MTPFDETIDAAIAAAQRHETELLAVPGVVAVESELTWRVDDTGRRAQRAAARL